MIGLQPNTYHYLILAKVVCGLSFAWNLLPGIYVLNCQPEATKQTKEKTLQRIVFDARPTFVAMYSVKAPTKVGVFSYFIPKNLLSPTIFLQDTFDQFCLILKHYYALCVEEIQLK